MIHDFYLCRQARFTIILILTVFFDQLTKFLFFHSSDGALNTGVSFSFFSESSIGQQIFLILLMVIFLGMIVWQFGKKFPLPVGLIAGGAVSNILDRVMFGGVRDFLPIPLLSVQNNLADWGIFIGLMGIVWREWWESREDSL